MNGSRFVFAPALCLLLNLTGCGNNDRVAGSGSVTTNGLTGRVLRDGLPASGVAVALYPADHDPEADSALPAKLRRLTDRSGAFAFEDLDTGGYNLIAENAGVGAIAMRQGIRVAKGDTARVDPLNLTAAAAIRVRLPEDARAVGDYVYLPGTAVSARIDSSAAAIGEVRLASVPAGSFDTLLYAGAGPVRNLLRAPLSVNPDGVGTVYPYASWSRGYRINLDASASGANTSSNVAGFPLLIRLSAADFDFAAANADGSDLRITKSDSATLLPFEIEIWDPGAGTASLWARMDTIRAGSPEETVFLFAGKPGAGPAKAAAVVFDTASGFAGVWHLDEVPVAGQPTLSDRSGNGFHGTAYGQLDAAASVAGVIGKALRLDGTGDYVSLAASDRFLPADGRPLSVSAWIRPSALAPGDSIRHRLATFKTDTAGISALALGVGADGRFSHYTRASDSVFHWPAPAGLDTLYHMGLTFAAGTFIGYVDGKEVFRVAAPIGKGGPSPALLGAHLPGKLGFAGLIDEFRIESAARSADWLRLSYATQKPGAACVKVLALLP